MKARNILFFIGTIAEYIKLFPIIESVKNLKIPYKVIASGQNNIALTDIAKQTGLKIDLQLSNEENIKKNAIGLFSWWLKTLPKSVRRIKSTFKDIDLKNSVIVVHGDTISTTLGVITARFLRVKSAHIEAGLRSGHLLTPFPEEIDRLVTSKLATYHFAPGEKPYNQLPECCRKFNTKYNTLIDALSYSESIPCKDVTIQNLNGEDYCVFVCHRQENLMQSKLVNEVVNAAKETAKSKKIVFIMHQITRNTLVSMNLYDELKHTPNVVLMDRVEYFDFMKLLNGAQFVITDGGSNQEELSYLGKPTLVIRKFTERDDGIGQNVVISKGDIGFISEFISTYKEYDRERIEAILSPSEMIAGILKMFLERGE